MKQLEEKIPGTSWFVKISAPNDKIGTIFIKFIKRSHVFHEFIIEKDGTLEEIFEKFIKLEDISVPRNRFETLIHQFNEELFDLETNLSVEQKSLDSMIKVSEMEDKKLLILGLAGAGKTSICKVIFEGEKWWDLELQDFLPTRGIQRYKYGSSLYIWDLGGQDTYLKEYRHNASEIFPQTTALIYVVDASDPVKIDKSRENFIWVMEEMKEYSPKGKIICFIHKMDKFSNQKETFEGIKNYFNEKLLDVDVEYCDTSYKDDTIFTAMKSLFKLIISKSKKLDILTESLKDKIGVYNVLVLEKRTGLPVCSSSTLFDDVLLIGTINKIWDSVITLAEDLDLVSVGRITVKCGNGYLTIEEFEENLLLMIISPNLKNIEDLYNQTLINQFILEMKNYI